MSFLHHTISAYNYKLNTWGMRDQRHNVFRANNTFLIHVIQTLHVTKTSWIKVYCHAGIKEAIKSWNIAKWHIIDRMSLTNVMVNLTQSAHALYESTSVRRRFGLWEYCAQNNIGWEWRASPACREPWWACYHAGRNTAEKCKLNELSGSHNATPHHFSIFKNIGTEWCGWCFPTHLMMKAAWIHKDVSSAHSRMWSNDCLSARNTERLRG